MRQRTETGPAYTAGRLRTWLRTVPDGALLGLLIEDDVVEIHPHDDSHTYGYFCLASGANDTKQRSKKVNV